MNDLIIGDTYGIYPVSWYDLDMTAPITQGKLRILTYGIRRKMHDTNSVVSITEQVYKINNIVTVEDALNTFYTMLTEFDFEGDIGLKNKEAVAFMKENGIFTGTNGELALTDTCSIEQACVFATRLVTFVFDKLDAASKGFLWVAKSGENTVYMLGSIHMASTEIYPFSNEMLQAYQSSDALAVEVNLYDLDGAYKLAELGVYMDGTTLKDHVSEETYQKVVALGTMFGYTEEMLQMIKPWYLYSMFAALANTNSADAAEANQATSLGIDLNFTTNALIYGKPILEVEGYEFQAQVLDSFSDELEEYLLLSTIEAINEIIEGTASEGSDDLEMILDLWHEGDTESYKKFTSMEYEYPELYDKDELAAEQALVDEFVDKLITQRDKRMAEYIETLLTMEGSTTYFVIVGSSHYISEYSVLDILEEKGYEITQIK
jgi:uncharacterized protein YbaP (TraB family)